MELVIALFFLIYLSMVCLSTPSVIQVYTNYSVDGKVNNE